MFKLNYERPLLGLFIVVLFNNSFAEVTLDFSGLNKNQQVVNAELILKDSYQLGAPVTPGDVAGYSLKGIEGELDSSNNWVLTSVDAVVNKSGQLAPLSDAQRSLMKLYDQVGETVFWLQANGQWGARGNDPEMSGTGGKWTMRRVSEQAAKPLQSQDCTGGDRFHKAAAKGDVNFVQDCLNAGVEVNVQEGNGWTALHAAARQGQIAVVDTLLRYDANPNIRDKTGRTPLDQATLAKQQKVIDILKNQPVPPSPIAGGQGSLPPPPAPGSTKGSLPPAAGGTPAPGSANQASINAPDVVKVAEFAAADLARWRPESMTSPYLHSIVKANKQVVAGTNYYLTIKTNDTGVYTWDVVVYEDLQGSMKITESKQTQ